MRYKCTVSYIGAGYEGWQTQKRGTSIQEQIEAALFRITGIETPITGAGRTDAGVNAQGQVFHFDSDLKLTPFKWKGAINGFLPKDIHITDVELVNQYFHARYCVSQKRYDYRIHQGEYDVFEIDRSWHCEKPLDVEKMTQASKLLIGYHDFSSFCSSKYEEYPDQRRTVDDIVFTVEPQMIQMGFIGKGFLRYMVRMMSAQLIEVGKNKITEQRILEMLEHPDKTKYRKNAAPEGLTLSWIKHFTIYSMDEDWMIRSDDEKPNKLLLCERRTGDIVSEVIRNEAGELSIENENKMKNIDQLLAETSENIEDEAKNLLYFG